jgi:hypothetical protein
VAALVEQRGKKIGRQPQPGLPLDQIVADKGGQRAPFGVRMAGKAAAVLGLEAQWHDDRQRQVAAQAQPPGG